jgi:protein O-mannosyl-transferase
MKKQKRQETKSAAAAVPAAPSRWAAVPWWYWLIGFGALFIVFAVYGPALHGPFVLDDLYLPYTDVNAPTLHFVQWLRNLRPLLMGSFWVDYQIGGSDPYSYHVSNVLLHFGVSVLVMLIVARLLLWAGVTGYKRQALAVFSGALFLLHPLQTESVAYVASRSDVLSVLFYYAAFAVFLYSNRDSLSLSRAIGIVILFGAAAGTKEHTLTLPLLILMTDFYWHRGGLRKNMALYGLLGVACAVGGVFVVRVLSSANTAGFGMKDLSPMAYFYTQCRVLLTYARMFILPYGQNLDPDIPVSQGLLDYGAVFGLIVLLAVTLAAWIYRKRFPLASFGVFVFLLLIAPTSSVVPIRDVLAERRVYLPFVGLILIVVEFLRRMEYRQMMGTVAAILAVCTVLTYQRSEVWSTSLALWKDTVEKSPRKMRPRFQLAFAQYQGGQCPVAAQNFEASSRLDVPDYRLYVDWGNALDCAGRENDAANAYNSAIQIHPEMAEAYVGLSAVYGKQRKFDEALKTLATAQAIDPNIAQIYLNRGGVYELQGDRSSAIQQYQQALRTEPSNRTAREALRRLGR